MGEFRQARWEEPPIFELGAKGRIGCEVPEVEEEVREEVGDVYSLLPPCMIRDEPPNLPEVSEVEVVRHYLRLSQMSYGVDLGPQPLGSCTMKYNPKVAEEVAWDRKVTNLHPLQREEFVQGILKALYELGLWLCEIVGLHKVSFQPAAGAHGELTGALIIRAYHKDKGEERDEMIIPDLAHGTNPASAAMAGFKVVRVPTDEEGQVDIEALKAAVSSRTAGMMLTNPNTLGVFERRILEIAAIVHEVGGLMYYDGANINGILGLVRPGDMGFDIVHLNIHKTFSSPHGGGGPGACALCVERELADYLPVPVVEYDKSRDRYFLNYSIPRSIGRVRAFHGNIVPLLRAYVYLLSLGPQGLVKVAKLSVLNTNYFMARVKRIKGLEVPYNPRTPRKHEVVISAGKLRRETGVAAEDLAKYLLDRGLHAPTIYFPGIVEESMMFEFTETETKENVDRYIEVLKEAVRLAYRDPSALKRAPSNTAIGRLDLVRANKWVTFAPNYWRYLERVKRRAKKCPT